MKKLVATVVILVALALPAAANASATITSTSFQTTITECNLNIDLSGSLLIIATRTSTPSGGFVSAIHFQPQNVTGMDEVSGTSYIGTGLTRDMFIGLPSSGAIVTFVSAFHIQATAGGQSFVVSQLFHITVTGDGTITAEVVNLSMTC